MCCVQTQRRRKDKKKKFQSRLYSCIPAFLYSYQSSTCAFIPGKKVDKHGGIVDKLSGIRDKLSGKTRKLSGTIVCKIRACKIQNEPNHGKADGWLLAIVHPCAFLPWRAGGSWWRASGTQGRRSGTKRRTSGTFGRAVARQNRPKTSFSAKKRRKTRLSLFSEESTVSPNRDFR